METNGPPVHDGRFRLVAFQEPRLVRAGLDASHFLGPYGDFASAVSRASELVEAGAYVRIRVYGPGGHLCVVTRRSDDSAARG
jgi:hypothetical protein